MIELTICFHLGEHDKNINKTNKKINKPKQIIRTLKENSRSDYMRSVGKERKLYPFNS